MKNINKYTILFFTATSLLLLASCQKEEVILEESDIFEYPYEPPAILPEGYFEVRFATGGGNITKSAIAGLDERVQHIRYIIYKSTGEYVKEKVIWMPEQGTANWPLPYIKDTLPNGNYTAVFLGNVDKNLFPNNLSSGTEVLTDYQTNRSSARIMLPNSEFSATTEYYMAETSFSDQSTTPTVLLQRIVGSATMHRNLVDAQQALDTLIYNVVTVNNYRDLLEDDVNNLLPGLLHTALGDVVGGGAASLLDGLIETVVGLLVEPITDALYDILLQQLTHQLGAALTGNTDQVGILGTLGVLLNPWNSVGVTSAIVTIDGFPKSVGFDLDIKERFEDATNFMFNFTDLSLYDEKDIAVKGFGEPANSDVQWQIHSINIARPGIVSGVVVDGVLDDLLLTGALIDINDPFTIQVGANRRFKNNYSFLNLELDQNTSSTNLPLAVQLGQVANLDGILGGIPILGNILLRPFVDGILAAIGDILLNVNVAVPLPVVGGSNLILSGSWEDPIPY